MIAHFAIRPCEPELWTKCGAIERPDQFLARARGAKKKISLIPSTLIVAWDVSSLLCILFVYHGVVKT